MSKKPEKLNLLLKLVAKREEEGKYFEAIELAEQALEKSKALTGANSNRTRSILEKLADLCNVVGMILLQQHNMKLSYELLKKAEIYAAKSLEKRSLTFNNLACFYKAEGKMRVALNYLQQALGIEKQLKNRHNIADLFLNICAVLSALKKHNEAYQASLSSVVLIQEELLELCLPMIVDKTNNDMSYLTVDNDNNSKLRKSRTSSAENVNPNQIKRPPMHSTTLQPNSNNNTGNGVSKRISHLGSKNERLSYNKLSFETAKKAKERVTILTIAYHNMAVELEHMKQYEEAMEVYQKACKLSAKLMNKENGLVENLKEVAETATIHLTEKIRKKPDSNKFILKSKKIQSAIAKPIIERNLRPKPKSEYVARPRIVSNYRIKMNVPDSSGLGGINKKDTMDDTIEELSITSSDRYSAKLREEPKKSPELEKKKTHSFAKSSGDVLKQTKNSLTENVRKSKFQTSPNEKNSLGSNSLNAINNLLYDNKNLKSGNRISNGDERQVPNIDMKRITKDNDFLLNKEIIPEAPEYFNSQYPDGQINDDSINNTLPELKIIRASSTLKNNDLKSNTIDLNQSVKSLNSSYDQLSHHSSLDTSKNNISTPHSIVERNYHTRNKGAKGSSIFRVIKNESLRTNSLVSDSESDVVDDSLRYDDIDKKSSLLSESDKIHNNDPELLRPEPKLGMARTMEDRPGRDVWEDMLTDNDNSDNESGTMHSEY